MALHRTPLFDWHLDHGGRMVEFGGWEMPVQYSGIVEEHRAVRTRAGLFDVSHMGEARVRGGGALGFLQKLVTNDCARLSPGDALYSPMCRPDGGILDDLLVYRLSDDDFLVVVNAANREKDLAWMEELASGFEDVEIRDETWAWGLLALQGPRAARILAKVGGSGLAEQLGRFTCAPGTRLAGTHGCIVARTGYTGEDGFECYVPWDEAPAVWEAVMAAGEPEGLLPAGLGARDTLRVEAALPLYGNDLTEETNPLETRLGPFVRFEKPDFVGREALLRVKEEGPSRRLVGLRLLEPGIARHGHPVFRAGEGGDAGAGRAGESVPIGEVTSGTRSPTLGESVALALVGGGARVGERLAVEIRGRRVAAEVVRLPFYRRASEG